MNRRYFLLGSGATIGAALLYQNFLLRDESDIALAKPKFEVNKTEEEWRQILTRQQYQVLRQEGTERPGNSPLLKEHRSGTFSCAGCALPLFASQTKYDSGTGWPSFYAPMDNSIETRQDGSRKEVHCRRCGGHLGHVFKDGPPPTGLRYCMNGAALKFEVSR